MRRRAMLTTSRLPGEYQEVEWIGSDGNAYIDLLFAPDADTDYEYDIICKLENFGTYSGIFGAYNSESQNTTRIIVTSSAGTDFYIYYGCKASMARAWPTVSSVTDKFRFILDSSHCHIYDLTTQTEQDVSLNSPVIGETTFATFKLFRYVGSTPSSSKFWSAKVRKANVLIRDMVPCYYKSSGVIGMYDLANNQFYTNAGTGTFAKGDDV